jgi:ubiquinone/menaquinone biosynthesis C-methylase UbiE
MTFNIYNEECLEGMKRIPDRSIDMVLCDLPYGTTSCEWDVVIPFDKLWNEYKRIVRPNGWVVLTAQNPFSAKLITSNINDYSHQWIWEKVNGANPFISKIAPIRNFEDVLCFQNASTVSNDYDLSHPLREYSKLVYNFIGKSRRELEEVFKGIYVGSKGRQCEHFFSFDSLQMKVPTEETYNHLIELYHIDKIEGFIEFKELKSIEDKWKSKRTYNPQMTKGKMYKSKKFTPPKHTKRGNSKEFKSTESDLRYPKALLKFDYDKVKLHPTQKPVALFEYLIKTYTNEGDTVLDNCMGSGTTGVACINTNRNFIGFELDENYFNIAKNRIEEHAGLN